MRHSNWMVGVAALGLLGATGGMLASGWVSAQEAPESLLPPGFDDPAPSPTPSAAPTALPTAPARPLPSAAPPVAAPAPGTAPPVAPGSAPIFTGPLPPVPTLSDEELEGIPTLEELEELTPDELDDRLGLKPRYDIPPAARRSLSQVGILASSEGGLPRGSLANQPASLVRSVLGGTTRPMVSRWGHILVRRTLASRLTAPDGMDPVEFAALRAGVLNRMGEFSMVRALVQDVDTGNWNTALTSQALTAYIGATDIVGACPAVRLQSSAREDARWKMMQAICNAYAGEGALAGSQLDAALGEQIAPDIDILLAQRFAGAAGRGRRGVDIDWSGVDEMTPWRLALANAVGEPIPDALLDDALSGGDASYYQLAVAGAPMLPLAMREDGVRRAARQGIYSANAMIDFYSQVYADNSIGGEAAERASALRNAYVGPTPEARINAMQQVWGDEGDYAGKITTAFAAARIAPSADFAPYAGNLIASMLAAGLDRDAAAWRGTMAQGSLGWALIAVGVPGGGAASADALDTFADNDDSDEMRATAFLVAGLAGLERISATDREAFEGRVGFDLSRQTRWTRMIDRAAEVNNPALVAMLVGLGMQGEDWSQMTPLHLYYITSSLRRVGLEAEARMIAAEAVARA